MADRPVNALADQRIQRRAQRQRQAVAEGEIGQRQADDAEDAPDVKAPVEEGDLHGLLGGIHSLRRAGRWRRIMQHRLGDTEEQQGDAVAGGEQHGEPGRETVLRLGVVRAQLDVAPFGQGDADDEHQEERHRQHVEPAEGAGDVRQHRIEQLAGQFRIARRADHQQQRDHHRGDEHGKQNDGLGQFPSGVHGRSASV